MSFAEGMRWETFESNLPGKEMLQLLQSVPGVGPVTAAVWLAEVVTPRRFPSPKALTAYIGCDPSLKVSAGKVTEHVKRKGNGNVHACLVQSAQMLVSFRREAFGIWGYSLACKHAKGGWQKAVGAVARRIGLGLYWVQRTGTPFTYDPYNLTVRKETLQDEPLENLPFSDRVKRLFVQYSVRTTHALVDGVENGLLRKRGFGPVSKKEIVSWLQNVRVGRKQKAPTPAAGRKDQQAFEPHHGLFVSGRILARNRREWPPHEGKGPAVCHTYRVLAGIDILFVDAWNQEPIPIGSDLAEVPVQVRAFSGRSGLQARLIITPPESQE